jgi:ABC-type nickel/cobalt efflux system permease component RcnA
VSRVFAMLTCGLVATNLAMIVLLVFTFSGVALFSTVAVTFGTALVVHAVWRFIRNDQQRHQNGDDD